MIDRDQAARIAHRLARHARKPDGLLNGRIVTRLWGLLETYPPARSAYACPHDRTLVEHAKALTPSQLAEAAARVEVAPPRGVDPESA